MRVFLISSFLFFCLNISFVSAQQIDSLNYPKSQQVVKINNSEMDVLEKLWSKKVHDFLEYHTIGDSENGLTNLSDYLVSGGVLSTSLKLIGSRVMPKNGLLSADDDIAEKERLKKIAKYKDIAARAYKFPDNIIKDDFNEAEKLILTAIKNFPKYTKAYLDLATIYEENQTPAKGVQYLKQLLRLKPDEKDAHLMMGLLLYKEERFDSSYLEYEKAIELMPQDEKDDFIFNSSQQMVEPYLKDKLNNISPDSLKIIIIKYWESRDPLYLTEYNERLLEHYARVSYADLRFGVAHLGIKGWKSYRGIALIRYGFPDAIIRLRGEMNTDVWEYPDKTFYFTDEYMNGEFKFGIPEMTKSWSSQNILLSQLKNQHPVEYKPKFKAIDVPYNIVQFKNPDSKHTDIFFNYALRFSDDWLKNGKYDFNHQIGAFLFNKYFEPVFNRIVFQFPVNYNNKIVTNAGNYNINSLPIYSTPDSGRVSFEVMRSSDSTVAAYQKNLTVKNFNKNILEISDIVLASDVEKGSIKNYPLTRNNITILPNPVSSFDKNQNLYIYYEVYNLGKNLNGLTDFKQNIILQKKDEDGNLGKILSPLLKLVGINKEEKKVELTSNYQTKDKDSQIYLQLDMTGYEPGDYVLIIKINDNIAGKETEQSTELTWR